MKALGKEEEVSLVASLAKVHFPGHTFPSK